MIESDLEYYRRRYLQETALEQAATTVEAASAHRALAMIYAEEVRRLTPAAPPGRIAACPPAPATATPSRISERI